MCYKNQYKSGYYMFSKFTKIEENTFSWFCQETPCMKNWSHLLLTMELKIITMFREHIDAESFKYTVLLMGLRVRAPTIGVENTSISGSWINRRQWCRWTMDPFQTSPSMYSSISFSGNWEAQSFADFKSFCMFNTGSPIRYLYLREDFLAAIYSQLS